MAIPKSLGGLVDKPLGFGPIDRGSNPRTDIFFLQYNSINIMAQGGTNTRDNAYIMSNSSIGPMWHHDTITLLTIIIMAPILHDY